MILKLGKVIFRDIPIAFIIIFALFSCTMKQVASVEVQNNSDNKIHDFNLSWEASDDGWQSKSYEEIAVNDSVFFDCLLAEYNFSLGGGMYAASSTIVYKLDGNSYRYPQEDEYFFTLSDGHFIIHIYNSDVEIER